MKIDAPGCWPWEKPVALCLFAPARDVDMPESAILACPENVLLLTLVWFCRQVPNLGWRAACSAPGFCCLSSWLHLWALQKEVSTIGQLLSRLPSLRLFQLDHAAPVHRYIPSAPLPTPSFPPLPLLVERICHTPGISNRREGRYENQLAAHRLTHYTSVAVVRRRLAPCCIFVQASGHALSSGCLESRLKM